MHGSARHKGKRPRSRGDTLLAYQKRKLPSQHIESLILVTMPVRWRAASRGVRRLELEIDAASLRQRDFQDARLSQQLYEFPCFRGCKLR